MNEEYTQKDITFKATKNYNSLEITGPTLKDMDFNKRFVEKKNMDEMVLFLISSYKKKIKNS